MISSGAMKALVPNLEKCIVKYKTCWAGDIRTALCLRDSGILVGDLPGLNNHPPQTMNSGPPCDKPVTFHHLLVGQIQELWTVESQLHSTNDKLITNADIYRTLIGQKQGEDFLTDIDMPGYDMKHFDSPNATSCHKSCRNEPKCISFSYVEGVCWLKDSMSEPKKLNGSVSGFFSDKYVCNM